MDTVRIDHDPRTGSDEMNSGTRHEPIREVRGWLHATRGPMTGGLVL